MASNTTAGTLVKTVDVQPSRRVLTVHERKALKDQALYFGYGEVRGETGSQLQAAPTEFPGMIVKRRQLNEQQKQVLKVLEDGSPRETTPDERDKIAKRMKIMEEKLPEVLQTRREIRAYSRRDPDFMSALEKAEANDKPSEKLGGLSPEQFCQEYQNLARTLDPENKNAGNLEKFRAK